MEYRYDIGNLIENPNTYFYSEFQGLEFMAMWERSRTEFASYCRSKVNLDLRSKYEAHSAAEAPTLARFRKFIQLLEKPDFPLEEKMILDAILRNFEAKKRLYGDYNSGFTSKGRTDCEDVALYAEFSLVLACAYGYWNKLPYLNALLKCLDIASAHRTSLNASQRKLMLISLNIERESIFRLAANLGVNLQ